jgi:hypothetical protein
LIVFYKRIDSILNDQIELLNDTVSCSIIYNINIISHNEFWIIPRRII